MIRIVHPIAGALAVFIISGFWLSTVLTELFATKAMVTSVKTFIPWGFFILIPALIAAGLSGRYLGRGRTGGIIGRKSKRMPIVALNGLTILIPSALFLSFKAQAGSFDAAFYTVQMIELCAGAVNIGLLGLNMRDGVRLSGKLRTCPASVSMK
ncbi:MAG: hypothetical protein AAGE61_09615 [Pseudomonadota bacterium]